MTTVCLLSGSTQYQQTTGCAHAATGLKQVHVGASTHSLERLSHLIPLQGGVMSRYTACVECNHTLCALPSPRTCRARHHSAEVPCTLNSPACAASPHIFTSVSIHLRCPRRSAPRVG